MVAYTKESLNELLENHNIIDILEKRIELTPAEGHYFTKCPFCKSNYSLLIMEDMNAYHCFSCHGHGDAVAFLMTAYLMTLDEAIKEVARISEYEGLIEINQPEGKIS